MKRGTLILALALCLICTAGRVWAAETDAISVTVSLESISVSLDNNTWLIGPIGLNDSSVLATVTAENDGNVDIDVDISATNGANLWNIGPAIGLDTFRVALADPAINLSTLDQDLVDSLAPAGTKAIDLTYYSPGTDGQGPGLDHSFTVTVSASESP